jgi:virulence factor Mce-like protein
MATARRRRATGRSPLTVGLIALAIVLVGTYLGFTKDIPFTQGFQLKAVFPSANSLRINSPVRIAGVAVGKVKSVEPKEGTDEALVTMEITDNGLPIHEDATAKIRPRIFLEGNFFVDLRPGTATSPVLESGDTLKVTQTATPVQLDQVLTALQSDTRQDLRDLLNGLALGLSSQPSAADDQDADPSARGQTAAQSWNDAYKDSPAALRGASQVNEALLGTEPSRDVARLLAGTAKTTGALIVHEAQLRDLITNFNTTMGAFASEQGNLRSSIRLLAPTLTNANAALASLNRAFPPTRAFAREILPGVHETAATISASFPWVAETRKLLSQSELRGLAQDLAPTTRSLAMLTDASLELLPQVDRTSLCARDVVLPTGDIVVHDEFDNGEANYKEFWQTMVGLAGESQNFDGNGSYVRFQPGGGDQAISMGTAGVGAGQVFGNNVGVPLGNRPFYPGKRPPYKPDVPCYTNKLPNVNGPAAAKTATTTVPNPGATP